MLKRSNLRTNVRLGKQKHLKMQRKRRGHLWSCYRTWGHTLTVDYGVFPRLFSDTNYVQQANLEALPPHVPTYLRAAVGPPTIISRRHFCTVCGDAANYTCVRCGVRFCSCRCQVIHNDTRCLKFVAWFLLVR